MSTAYRRKITLRQLAADDATRRVSDGVSRWHSVDVKNEPPIEWHTHGQLLGAIAVAFVAGFVAAIILAEVIRNG